MILQGAPGTGKTYQAKSLAYYLVFGKPIAADKPTRDENLKQLVDSDQFALLQFHPAYTYEDFVRGISARSNGTTLEYVTENKILAEFAERAHQNHLDSQKLPQNLSAQEKLKAFMDFVNDSAEESPLKLTPTVNLSAAKNQRFKYKSANREYAMQSQDILTLYLHSPAITERKQIKQYATISGFTREHATYTLAILNQFRKFITENPINIEVAPVQLQNYVLIIDEINRANLPSVLGELIYALEYRGEPVESMYALDDDKKLILPKNLYIIGTMNTADRSIGHIDYAIRRRFAFVDVPADKTVIINDLAKGLFDEVQKIFKEFIAADFEIAQVELGHSYFIADDDDHLTFKLEYEIKPILREYVKDGILKADAKSKIGDLKC